MTKQLYLIPVDISAETTGFTGRYVSPEILGKLQIIFVEDIRSARRFFRTAGYTGDLNNQDWVVIDRDLTTEKLLEKLDHIEEGKPAAIISEAGIPGIADPGSDIVAIAHEVGIRVIPIPGPSSIFLALASSGLNGQSFTFHGYLPVHENERNRQLKKIEQVAMQTSYTQIFMETPYRNMQLFKSILKVCNDNMRLCIAADITGYQEFIRTMSIAEWRSFQLNIHKIPAVFLLNQ